MLHDDKHDGTLQAVWYNATMPHEHLQHSDLLKRLFTFGVLFMTADPLAAWFGLAFKRPALEPDATRSVAALTVAAGPRGMELPEPFVP